MARSTMGNKRKKRSSLSEECPKKNTEGEKGEQLIMKESKKRRIEETNEKIEENGHQLDEISVEDFNEDNERLEIDDENSSKQKIKDKEAGKEHETEFREKDQSLPQSNSFFSEIEFNDLPICEPLKEALVTMNMKTLTEIQAKSIPILLEGRDVLGAARTGSGKTLAFLLPALDMMYKVKFLPRNGTGVIVISPTRELALQIYDVSCELSKNLPQTHGLIMGGVNRRQEAEKLVKGVNLLIGTPGRLLDHLQGTKGFVYSNLAMLVIDEADRILEIGFEEDMNAILKILPSKRQTALFSATQTAKVADLARLSLRKPVLVDVKSLFATVEGLEQGFIVCPAAERFKLLFTFLKKIEGKK